MRVPLSWLRDFAPFSEDAPTLAATFDDLGMVVEAVERVGRELEGVVVARVVGIDPIPKADRIRLVHVDAGDGKPLQVVCGAWNFDVGDHVAFAPVGTVLPGGLEIGRRTVRGVDSYGMICSPRELALGDDHEGILVLPQPAAVGAPLGEALGIETDVVFDLAVEGNRPDAMSVAGVARDAAARLGLPFALPEPSLAEDGPGVGERASVAVHAPELCPRFTARVVSAVSVGPSPRWVLRRLTLAGMRPINNVVDASNYVMLELGQPTHPYDLHRLPGAGLLVRRAERGETLVTLDGVERRLGDGDDCLICDAEGAPVGIGGIIGGASSEISETTTTVLLEAAYFDPMAIAATSRRLNLRTEASARFERGCDPEGIDRASARFFQVMGMGRVAPGMLDERAALPAPHRIAVRTARVNAILGTELADEEVARYLGPIGFQVRPAVPGVQEVLAPSFRPDVEAEIDVIEEVARHHGYSRIARTVPRSPYVGRLTAYQRDRRRVREILAGAGVSEAITSSLLAPGDHERAGLGSGVIRAANPLMQEESVLRASLLPGLLRAVAFNAARRVPGVRFFEIGHVFRPPPPTRPAAGRDAELPDEHEHLAVALAGAGDDAVAAKRVLDVLTGALRLDGVVLEASVEPGLHPTRTAQVRASGELLGVVGEVDPSVVEAWAFEGRVGWVELELERLLEAPRRPAEQRPISRYPSSDIDLAFVVDDSVPAAAVERTLSESGGELLVDLGLFDVYRGEQLGPGRRSLAYRLRFCALDHTLTDEELAAVRARCIEAVETAHPAELRG
jgi:phenylalanyl-tRNA synthetase beta chain